MEPVKHNTPKISEMIMCGDHPSFTKNELNFKEDNDEKDKKNTTHKVSPSSSRTERGERAEQRLRATSEHALRMIEARRRVRSLDAVPRQEVENMTGNRALVQAALGSFRWPPYLLCVWVLVLVVTHGLHCAVTLLERALPNLKKLCIYFRAWTEDSWKIDGDFNQRLFPFALALLTGLLYTLYCTLYVVYSVALWSIEPLCGEVDEKPSTVDVMETKITNYIDDVNSKTNCALKHKEC